MYKYLHGIDQSLIIRNYIMEKAQTVLETPKTDTLMEITEKKCVLRGLNPIMFDRYGGDK